jgi:hypothetical protein
MRTYLTVPMLVLSMLPGGCSPSTPAPTRDSVTARDSISSREMAGVSRDEAIRLARQFISRAPVASAVHLDSVEVAEAEATWHVMFRRRALMMPAVVTVDVDRRSGAMRFPGDE